jgi:hypothetical protein
MASLTTGCCPSSLQAFTNQQGSLALRFTLFGIWCLQGKGRGGALSSGTRKMRLGAAASSYSQCSIICSTRVVLPTWRVPRKSVIGAIPFLRRCNTGSNNQRRGCYAQKCIQARRAREQGYRSFYLNPCSDLVSTTAMHAVRSVQEVQSLSSREIATSSWLADEDALC